MDPQTNVALKKPAQQSSDYSNPTGQASNAVSGCRSGVWPSGCCTHTTLQADPWWKVDLLDVFKVSAVSIYNRQDCCPERLLGAEVLIGNSLQYNNNAR